MDGKDDSGLSERAKHLQQTATVQGAVGKWVGAAIAGGVGGYALDRAMGWAPWGTVALATLGISVGLYAFLRDVSRIGKG